MTRLATLAITGLMLMSTVGCFRSRCAGYGGACPPCGGACGAPAGGVYGAPTGGGGYYSPTGSSVNLGVQSNGPVAYGGYPTYSTPYPTTAFAPMDPLPTY
ncbi:hypothetical protein [uncultured Rubinisphaera sp.]|uniref:hypothetical protein n=1 Tax=uncultured Rubinisphaera sp. TaxID=1678686 RepID=UPI000EC8ACAC|nr:hypothetical protein [Planctomycetaceae bacterium]